MHENILVDARIEEIGYKNQIIGVLSSGNEVIIGIYFPDEIYYNPGDFIGLTYDQAVGLLYDNDRRYLQT